MMGSRKQWKRTTIAVVLATTGTIAWSVGPAAASEHRATFGTYSFVFTVPDELDGFVDLLLDNNEGPENSTDPGETSASESVSIDRAGLQQVPTWIPSVHNAVRARNALGDLNGRVNAFNSSKSSLPSGLSATENSALGVEIERLNDAQREAAKELADVQGDVRRVNSFTASTKSSLTDPAIDDLLGSITNARQAVANANAAIGAVNHAR